MIYICVKIYRFRVCLYGLYKDMHRKDSLSLFSKKINRKRLLENQFQSGIHRLGRSRGLTREPPPPKKKNLLQNIIALVQHLLSVTITSFKNNLGLWLFFILKLLLFSTSKQCPVSTVCFIFFLAIFTF